jgi:hypothetical protein
MPGPTAAELRKSFRDIPRELRDTHQSFAIRIWRALSWLERAEQATEAEDRFIACWIGFNALYGRQDDQNRAWGDREAMGTFLATIWRLDDEDVLRHLLFKRQLPVLRLIENKWLYDRFWAAPKTDHQPVLSQLVKRLLREFGQKDMLPVLQLLFERIYVMRLQVFHGASTKGSSLNRRALNECTGLLHEFLPLAIEVMIGKGLPIDWGAVCFPPMNAENGSSARKGDQSRR